MGGAGRSLEAFGDMALRLILWRSCPQRSQTGRHGSAVRGLAVDSLAMWRRFFCCNPDCPITITMAAEQVDGLAAPG